MRVENGCELPNKAGIYRFGIETPHGFMIYFGESLNLGKRITSYKYVKEPGRYIDYAIRKYGWGNVQIKIIATFNKITKIELLEIESFFIAVFDTTNPKIGYNILEYGNVRIGTPISEETKKKMSAAHLKRQYFGKKHHAYGKKLSPERIEQIKEENRKRDWSSFCKQVRQIDLNSGCIIKIWKSVKGASAGMGKTDTGPITRTCNKKEKQGFGFKWEWSNMEEYINFKKFNPNLYDESVKIPKLGRKRPVKQLDLKTKRIVALWESISAACVQFNNRGFGTISCICRKYKRPHRDIEYNCFGFTWEYATVDEYNEYIQMNIV